ncbi:dipeptidyl peptidase 3-like [Watersipora subatra]|uniref:dipeptidyl peptidase 3-like n=1 Tax=Watersipora subatra TaxID=2589382 RepID=UPI00355AD398
MDASNHILPNETDFCLLECKEAFNCLTSKEKKYAHYLSRASWYGGLIVLFQTSPESPCIHLLLINLIRHESVEQLKQTASVAGLSEQETQAFFVYAAAIFANSGNYKSFGDSKIIPNLPKSQMEKLMKASNAYKKEPELITELWTDVGESMYSLSARETQLGLGDQGITTYFSSNCTKADAAIAKEFLTDKKIPCWNTRCLKHADGKYEIRLASVESTKEDLDYLGDYVFTTSDSKEHKFSVTRGDYSELLKLVAENLTLAKEFAANENQQCMLAKYVESFTSGSLDAHKDGSRSWIKDKGPVIESYIGFIEVYRDPVSARGEFEGFVAMVNKEMSAKFSNLVDNATKFLALLPWPKELEKDKFLKPDFTSLDVLTFSGSGIPAGINIPNYDEIRQSEGFKNVSLGNVLSSSYKKDKLENITFLAEEDKELLSAWKSKAFEVQVGLHELLGHGSGKLFCKEADGTFNFDQTILNPLSNEPISSWYMPGETFYNKFPGMSSSYEECRAECVGLLLCLDPDVLSVFGYSGEEAEHVIYINWLSMARAGLLALEFFSPDTQSWRQAHMQARYAILQVMLKAEGLVNITECAGKDGKQDLLLSLDKTKIATVGKQAIVDMLMKLQVYKATADYTKGKQWYQDDLSAMTNTDTLKFTDWRQIVLNRKVPRKMLVQCNTFVSDGEVTLCEYDQSAAGLVQSVAERFREHSSLDTTLMGLYKRDKHFWT